MSRLGQLSSFAPITIAALIGLAGVAFGDDVILPPVRVDGDATKMATRSTSSVGLRCGRSMVWGKIIFLLSP